MIVLYLWLTHCFLSLFIYAIGLDPTLYFSPLKDSALVPQDRLDTVILHMQQKAQELLDLEKRRKHTLQKNDVFPNCEQVALDSCPENWKITTNIQGRVLCSAPYTYQGFCKRELDFNDMDDNQKVELATQCDFQWPCSNSPSCVPDFDAPCPRHFLLLSEKSTKCIPDPTTYHGTCLEEINFIGFTERRKLAWAKQCDTNWPCKKDISPINTRRSPCPQGWTRNNSMATCTAPQDSPCKGSWKFTYWTEAMKDRFTEACNILWVFENVDCEEDLMANCPKDWTRNTSSAICIANRNIIPPQAVLNTCSYESVDFTNMTETERRVFSEKCNVKWPCKIQKRDCDRDWSRVCPEMWSIKDNITQECQSIYPSTLVKNPMYDCVSSRSFIKWGETERRKWASACDAPWPCLDEVMENKEVMKKKSKWHLYFQRPILPHVGNKQTFRKTVGGPVNSSTGKIILDSR